MDPGKLAGVAAGISVGAILMALVTQALLYQARQDFNACSALNNEMLAYMRAHPATKEK